LSSSAFGLNAVMAIQDRPVGQVNGSEVALPGVPGRDPNRQRLGIRRRTRLGR
jgi:hypothetical protein